LPNLGHLKNKKSLFQNKEAIKIADDGSANNSSTNDENSFAWVPVKQAWGSEQFGAHFTPRVGQEVLVSFEHGNPNKPVIIGVLLNDSNRPPFATTPSKLGFASRSLDKEALQKDIAGHQFVFDDNPNSRTFYYNRIEISPLTQIII
jgi:uncharacterized protein involved in type VI secretion and phage assembly